mmetsp:Transcript_77658/g.227714  ORF Transcript_77658/g.227714 Transcript_77658/m.227714 type:complete len:205 (-) Transcript_77658:403-1017(-)
MFASATSSCTVSATWSALASASAAARSPRSAASLRWSCRTSCASSFTLSPETASSRWRQMRHLLLSLPSKRPWLVHARTSPLLTATPSGPELPLYGCPRTVRTSALEPVAKSCTFRTPVCKATMTQPSPSKTLSLEPKWFGDVTHPLLTMHWPACTRKPASTVSPTGPAQAARRAPSARLPGMKLPPPGARQAPLSQPKVRRLS